MKQSALILLGMLISGPKHGYDLEQTIKATRMRDWAKIGASTIFATLRRLNQQGMLTIRQEQHGRRPVRNVYGITNEGREAFKEALVNSSSDMTPLYSSRVTAAVFAADLLPDIAEKMIKESLRELRVMQRRITEDLISKENPIEYVLQDYNRGLLDMEINALKALSVYAERDVKASDTKEKDQMQLF